MDKLTVKYKVDKWTNEYGVTKRYLLTCNANDSFPERIDRIYDNTMICYTDGYILEVEFDDDNNKIIYHQVYDKNTLELIKIDSANGQEIFNNLDIESYNYHFKLLSELYERIGRE